MKKKFKLEDLDCANVSFMTQKMMVDAVDDKFDDIMKEVVKICAKVEPDCKILM